MAHIVLILSRFKMAQKVSNDLAQIGVFLLGSCKERRNWQYYLLAAIGVFFSQPKTAEGAR